MSKRPKLEDLPAQPVELTGGEAEKVSGGAVQTLQITRLKTGTQHSGDGGEGQPQIEAPPR